jgi:hypothetical protein
MSKAVLSDRGGIRNAGEEKRENKGESTERRKRRVDNLLIENL